MASEQIIDDDQLSAQPMNECNKKKYMLKITIKSMDAANRVLLRSSIDFIKITAQRAYFPLRPC